MPIFRVTVAGVTIVEAPDKEAAVAGALASCKYMDAQAYVTGEVEAQTLTPDKGHLGTTAR